MDGNLPTRDKQPISSDHPNSIFALFGKTHRMNVSEEATVVCSRELCSDQRAQESYADRMGSMAEDLGLVWLHVASPPDIESKLTSVSENWGNFGGDAAAADRPIDEDTETLNTRANLNRGRPGRFEDWIDKIEPGRRPGLNFKHTLLPHVPWQYLPSGRVYRRLPNDAIPGLSNQAYDDQGQLDVLLQRHYLQTGFTDLELQRLWRKLKRDGQWDDALIVVAADHGVAFPLGSRQRRRLGQRHRGRDRADPAADQGAGAAHGPGRRRLRGDHRHPAHDVRPARPRPQRQVRRPVRVQRRGAGPRRAPLPDPQHLQGAAH